MVEAKVGGWKPETKFPQRVYKLLELVFMASTLPPLKILPIYILLLKNILFNSEKKLYRI